MQRLHVHRERREEQVIGLGNGAARLMLQDVTNAKFLEIFSCHDRLVVSECCSDSKMSRWCASPPPTLSRVWRMVLRYRPSTGSGVNQRSLPARLIPEKAPRGFC